jgi:uncharacterized protein (TIGR03435 family)
MRVGMNGGPGTHDPTRITYQNVDLTSLVAQAYDVKRFQISGPSWLHAERFDVTAKVPEGATKEQVRLMLQNLLAERFKLAVHHEKKEMPIYELLVAKSGLKIKESVEDSEPKDGGPGGAGGPPAPGKPALDKDGFPVLPAGRGPMMIFMNGRARMKANQLTMADFAGMLSNQLGRPVTDGTGLKGEYDIMLSFVPENMGPVGPMGKGGDLPPGAGGGMVTGGPAGGGMAVGGSPGGDKPVTASDDAGPTLFAALQEQLGLKLEAKKGAADLLVIDHIERTPIEN